MAGDWKRKKTNTFFLYEFLILFLFRQINPATIQYTENVQTKSQLVQRDHHHHLDGIIFLAINIMRPDVQAIHCNSFKQWTCLSSELVIILHNCSYVLIMIRFIEYKFPGLLMLTPNMSYNQYDLNIMNALICYFTENCTKTIKKNKLSCYLQIFSLLKL